MRVRVLRPAFEDLAAGRPFYGRQEQGVGDYFFDSLFSEIDSLVLYAGIHPSSVRISSVTRQALSVCSLLPNHQRHLSVAVLDRDE